MAASQTQMQFEIEARDLTKAFGRNYALRGLNLKLAKGDFLTIVGPNGAGKTTLMRCLAGLSKPSSGTVLLRGEELRKGGVELRRRIGLVSHQPLLYDNLTAMENLRFYGRMYDVPQLEQRVEEIVRYVGLGHRLREPVRAFSRGMRQRLSIARALIHEPPVMLLDEPYAGLDEQGAQMLRGLLQGMTDGEQTVVIATHDLERALGVGRRLGILVGGRILHEGPMSSLDLQGLRQMYEHCAGGSR